MSDERVALHFSKADTTRAFPTLIDTTSQNDRNETSTSCSHLNRLSCQWVNGTGGSYLKLVEYHVSQPLIVNHTEVDVGSKLLTCYTRIHWFIAIVVIPSGS